MNGAPLPPLAERMRPEVLDDYIGQTHLLGPDGPLRGLINNKTLTSMLLWGPPGVGKTTLARLLALESGLAFYSISAVQAGLKEVRQVMDIAKKLGKAVLFIDEIHRFNKAQQDALLGAVEQGYVVLIGATTENPSFEVINALLSRCQVYVLRELDRECMMEIANRALLRDTHLRTREIALAETDALLRLAQGDARKLLNLLELVSSQHHGGGKLEVTDDLVQKVAQQLLVRHDKDGEGHYNLISAFIKSMRGSDPNAAVYYLARMLAGGEDPKFVARRMAILASEDIGNANPTALVLATNCLLAVMQIGMPEARIILSQTAIYLATSPKSNAAYMAIESAYGMVEQYGELPVPMSLRNAPTKWMKQQGYGDGYAYAHDYENNFVRHEYMPDRVKDNTLYQPGNNEREQHARAWLRKLWKGKYGY
ncbi:MAG: replication-associated recombination protein A [Bacteroidetes bacterium]|nr:replication-associated recombination protein A [Bacteroidota bacterium]